MLNRVARLAFFFYLLPILVFGAPADCRVFFSQKDQLADKLIEQIDREKKSVKVAIYAITHLGIAKSLVRAKERGVAVEVLLDPFSVKVKTAIKQLRDGDVPLFVWDQDLVVKKTKRKSLMHDKFCILGDRLVWTGSFNFTNDANLRHQENVVLIDSAPVAAKFQEQFLHMKLYQSRPLDEYVACHPNKKKVLEVKR